MNNHYNIIIMLQMKQNRTVKIINCEIEFNY